MTDALEDHSGTVSIGDKTITDDIDSLAGEELVERLDKASSAYGMQTSAEKTKLMTNTTQKASALTPE